MNILLSGCSGKMGMNVRESAQDFEGAVIAAGVDIKDDPQAGFPVYDDFSKIKEKIDVIIDFSHFSNLENVLGYAVEHRIPAVLCTTGYSEEQKSLIRDSAALIPVFYSANMSLGVNLQIKLAKIAREFFGNDADIEIIEMHHNRKLDAPSGTALAIADALNQDGSYEYTYDRQPLHRKRKKSEIGISSVRGGNIVGEHDVMFICENERIEIKHIAESRKVFADGALKAAAFLKGKCPGLYDMNSLIG